MRQLTTPGILLSGSVGPQPVVDDPDETPSPTPAPERLVTYQRSHGDDASADGSLDRPFKTLRAALETWPIDAHGNTYVIDRTGCTDQLPPAFVLPAYRDSRSPVLRFPIPPPMAPFAAEGAFNLLAEHRTLATIEKVGAVINHPRSQLVTVTVPEAVWNENQWRGRQVITADGYVVAIAGNGANSLQLCTDWAPTLPFRIVEPSAVLLGDADPAYARGGLNLGAAQAGIVLGGQLIRSTAAWAGAVQAYGCFKLTFWGCELEGDLQLGESQSLILFVGCSLRPGPGFGAIMLDRGTVALFSSMVEGHRIRSNSPGSSELEVFQSSVQRASAPLGLDLARLQVYHSEIVGSSGALVPGGVVAGAPSSALDLLSAAGGEITLDGVHIDGCAGDGVSVGLRSAGLIRGVGGTNAGVGLRVWNGAQVLVDATSDISGAAGDFRVGSRPVRAWAHFRGEAPIGNEADYFDATSDGSRLFQG